MLHPPIITILLLTAACSDRERLAANTRAERSETRTADTAATEPACDGGWRERKPGLRHRNLCTDGDVTLHQVEIDPSSWTLDGVRVSPMTAPAVTRERNASFAINANFFDPDRKPLGVIVSGGTVVQRPHPVSWQSIFYTTSEAKAAIVLPEQWDAVRESATMAVQAGPRLIADGKPTGATRGNGSLRSGVCITADERVSFFVTTLRRLWDMNEMTELAARSEERGGLGCHDAMLFDGGPSAQMYLEGSGISTEGDLVPAFVIARPRATAGTEP